MEKTLVITFSTEDKKSYQLEIRKPKSELAKEVIVPIANKIIETGILNNSKRILKSVKKVAYVTREENVLE